MGKGEMVFLSLSLLQNSYCCEDSSSLHSANHTCPRCLQECGGGEYGGIPLLLSICTVPLSHLLSSSIPSFSHTPPPPFQLSLNGGRESEWKFRGGGGCVCVVVVVIYQWGSGRG
jgi:hypothetical protein